MAVRSIADKIYGMIDYINKVGVKMLVFEAKLEGEKQQYRLLDEAIRTAVKQLNKLKLYAINIYPAIATR